MSHPGSSKKKKKKRIRVEEDELSDTGIEMADDCEIQADHELEESSGLLSRKRVVRKKSCMHTACRIMMGIMATAVFTFMLIQLWMNYGDDIKKRVFSPQVVGAGCFDEKGEHGEMFGMQFHKWVNSTLHINMTKPEHDLIQINLESPQPWSYNWDEDCLKIAMDTPDHITVMVWSI